MNGKVSIVGSIVASAGSAASWVCCLPTALGILGAGGAVASTLGPLRPYLLGLSVIFWVSAFYALYRPGSSCRDGDCAAKRSLRARRTMLWIAGLVTLAMMTVTYWGDWVIFWLL